MSPRAQLRCYGAGQNFFWQLSGTPDAPRRADTPVRLEWLEAMRPSALACGGHFSYAVSERDGGAVFRWGTDNGRVIPAPERVGLPHEAIEVFGSGGKQRRAVAVACGAKHTLILLDGGLVLGTGVGYFGQLGCGDDASSSEPRIIKALSPGSLGGGGASGSGGGDDRVVSVAAGGLHSGCLTKAGGVYMWGFNRSGQCGVGGKNRSTISSPVPIDGSEELRACGRPLQLVCGRHHSSLLTEGALLRSQARDCFFF